MVCIYDSGSNVMKISESMRKMLVLQLSLVIGGVLVILLIRTGIIQYIFPPCITREIFGVICPSCGITRCVSHMINFKFDMAFLYHPTFFLAIIYLFFINIIYILQVLTKKECLKKLYPNWIVGVIFLVVFIVQYVYRVNVIITGRGFDFL